MHPPEIDPAYLSNDYDIQCSIDSKYKALQPKRNHKFSVFTTCDGSIVLQPSNKV